MRHFRVRAEGPVGLVDELHGKRLVLLEERATAHVVIVDGYPFAIDKEHLREELQRVPSVELGPGEPCFCFEEDHCGAPRVKPPRWKEAWKA